MLPVRMQLDKIAILPALGVLYLLINGKDTRTVFITYFLPVLTLIPAYYETKLISGIPEFSFWSSVLIPVFMIWILNEKMEGYKFTWLDMIIILHLVLIFYAQFEATGYKDAQKILFRESTKRLLPYLIFKAILLDNTKRIDALKMITNLGVIVSVFMLFEMKFYYNAIDLIIRNNWPYNVPWDGVLSRYGFKRAAGSFAHPISAGYFFAMSAPLAFWLWREKYYENDKIGLGVFIANSLGVLSSISRAPIAGLLLSSLIIWFGWSKSKTITGGLLIFVSILGLAVIIPKFSEYVSIDRSNALTRDQENAAYRKEMLDNYIDVIKEKPYWGYGRYTFPVINDQKSIDNEYLFIAITAGLNNLVVYLIIIITVLVKLLRYAFSNSWNDKGCKVAWVLLGIWLSAIFTQATVYSGMQTTHYFFMMAALAEVLVIRKNSFVSEHPKTTEIGAISEYNFSRTL